MQINTDLTQRLAIASGDLPWLASPLKGVDRIMLERDGDEVARATSLVRYAPKSSFSLGVPIFDRLSQPIAGLSISFPIFRYVEADAPKYIQFLKDASNSISASLGCTKSML